MSGDGATDPGFAELRAQLKEWRESVQRFLPPWWSRALAGGLILIGGLLPLLFTQQTGFFGQTSDFLNATVLSLAYAVMALGLNIVVGFAGLLDLGYVAFYALGAYTAGWLGSDFFFKANLHIFVSKFAGSLPGIHLNIILVLIIAAAICAVAGMIIGLPTLRLRGDYIAIVTLAFGEIIGVVAVNGQDIHIGGGMSLTAGNFGISAIDPPWLPGVGSFSELDLRPWYWLIFGILLFVLFCSLRLRDSRLGRAWIALREDEVAAVSMGIPSVRTKLSAYSIGAAFGGMSGAFLGAFHTVVSGSDFQFGFSVFILSMVIIGGLGIGLGSGLRGHAARLHQLLPDPGCVQQPAKHVRTQLPADHDRVRDLRVPARAGDAAASAGPDTRAKTQAGADRDHRGDRHRARGAVGLRDHGVG